MQETLVSPYEEHASALLSAVPDSVAPLQTDFGQAEEARRSNFSSVRRGQSHLRDLLATPQSSASNSAASWESNVTGAGPDCTGLGSPSLVRYERLVSNQISVAKLELAMFVPAFAFWKQVTKLWCLSVCCAAAP